MGVKQEK